MRIGTQLHRLRIRSPLLKKVVEEGRKDDALRDACGDGTQSGLPIVQLYAKWPSEKERIAEKYDVRSRNGGA